VVEHALGVEDVVALGPSGRRGARETVVEPALDEPGAQLRQRHVEAGGEVPKRGEPAPGLLVEQEVAAFEDHHARLRGHDLGAGDGEVAVPVEDGHHGLAALADAGHEVPEAREVVRLGRALALVEAPRLEHGGVDEEAVERDEARGHLLLAQAAHHRGGEGGLAGPRRAGRARRRRGGARPSAPWRARPAPSPGR
jgi:hypothetical protein